MQGSLRRPPAEEQTPGDSGRLRCAGEYTPAVKGAPRAGLYVLVYALAACGAHTTGPARRRMLGTSQGTPRSTEMKPEKLTLTQDHQSTAPTTRTARPSARLGRLATTHRSAGAAVIASCLLVAVVSATQLALRPAPAVGHAELQRAAHRVDRLPGPVHDRSCGRTTARCRTG